MFIFNNIAGKEYQKIYVRNEEQLPVIFDIFDWKLKREVNSQWNEIKVGDLACIVSSSSNMSRIYKIASIESVKKNEDNEKCLLFRGQVIAQIPEVYRYTLTLNKYGVKHEKLKNNRLPIGFAVANLGSQMDSVKVKTQLVAETLGELKELIGSVKAESAIAPAAVF
jgi:hypothetical protein